MKRLVVIVVAGIFFIVALVYFNVQIFGTNDGNSRKTEIKKDSTTASLRDPMADSDGDGLANWEEDLYNSSKKNTDSDGDGISDGQEVTQGTDPTVYGTVPLDIDVVHENTQRYEFQQTANPHSIDDVLKMMSGVVENNPDPVIQTGGPTPAPSPLKICINELAVILQNSLVTSAQDSNTISNYLIGQTSNTYPIEQMSQAASTAVLKLDGLDTQLCPELDPHVKNLSQAYRQQETAISKILGTTASTSEHYEAWQVYSNTTQAWIQSVMKIRDLADGKGLVFSSSEPGYLFTQGF